MEVWKFIKDPSEAWQHNLLQICQKYEWQLFRAESGITIRTLRMYCFPLSDKKEQVYELGW